MRRGIHDQQIALRAFAPSWFCILPLLALIPGCIGKRPANPATTQPVTMVDPKYATPDYWWSQPASITVSSNDFNTLWETCERLARDWHFTIERRDFRAGMLITDPIVSKQFWEWWRHDAGSFTQAREATLGNIRRTFRFQFAREPNGGWSVAPKVLVERQSIVDVRDRTEIVLETPIYWYALRRDTQLETKIADALRNRLGQAAPVAASPAPPPGGDTRLGPARP